jgi:hypothetical protein
MGLDSEVVIHMDGEDHRSIARYKSRTCPSYGKVLAKLKEAVDSATRREFCPTISSRFRWVFD